MDVLKLLLAPIAECLVLVGIHSYLGIHVIRRGVIFIDLALAQIAALGATVGLLIGLMPDSSAEFLFSVAFTFVGAAVFALSRTRSEKIPQEAVIGLVYAIAAAVAILVIDRSPSGAEHLKEILVGRIVWVRWREVGGAAAAYALVGGVHFLLRDRFMLISADPREAFRRGINVRLWDFVFYMTFGFVISYSVSVAGVLLVFVFLVVPAIAAILVTDRLLYQLLIGWGMGTVVSIAGMLLSYYLNLPGGPTVVAAYGLALLLVVLILHVARARRRAAALLRVGLGAVLSAAVLVGLIGSGLLMRSTFLARSELTAHGSETHEPPPPPPASLPAGAPTAVTADDAGDWFDRAETLLAEGKKKEALEILIVIVSSPEAPPFFRQESLREIEETTGMKTGYDASKPPADNAGAVEKMKKLLGSI